MNIPTTLPFFNGTRKQATRRDGSPCVIFSPRTQLPPFQIKRPHVADDWVDDIFLVDCDGNETDIADYFNKSSELILFNAAWYSNGPGALQAMDTLTATSKDITSAIKTTTAAGNAGFSSTTNMGLATGERVYLEIVLTLNSGVAPDVYLIASEAAAATPTSNIVQLEAGTNKIILNPTGTSNLLCFRSDSAHQTNFSATVTLKETNRPEINEFTSVDYIQYSGPLVKRESMINEAAWVNAGTYDTFTTNGTAITSAIELGAAGAGYLPSSPGDMILTGGKKYLVYIPSVVINSGQVPTFTLISSNLTSNSEVVAAGNNLLEITMVGTVTDTDGRLQVYNTSAANWSCGAIQILDSIDLLPRGTHYIKITDGTNEWYSEFFEIRDIYENLISSITASSTYETLVTSGTKIISAINSAGTGQVISDSFDSVSVGDKIYVVFFLILNSGQLPSFRLWDVSTISDTVVSSEGINLITLTVTNAASDPKIVISNASNTNFSTSEIWVHRQYSDKFVKLAFSNSKDLHGKRSDDQTILYQKDFEQECWLDTILNTPAGNRVDIGDEKDGVYIPEKITTQYKYRIVAYVNRSLFEGLIRLPQHDDITIIDEVGNEYTPDTGNIILSEEWTTFDICTLAIEFNDGSFVWTENSDDIT